MVFRNIVFFCLLLSGRTRAHAHATTPMTTVGNPHVCDALYSLYIGTWGSVAIACSSTYSSHICTCTAQAQVSSNHNATHRPHRRDTLHYTHAQLTRRGHRSVQGTAHAYARYVRALCSNECMRARVASSSLLRADPDRCATATAFIVSTSSSQRLDRRALSRLQRIFNPISSSKM